MSSALVVLTCPRDDDEPFGYFNGTVAQIERERAFGADVVAPAVVCDQSASSLSPTVPRGWGLRLFARPPGTIHGNKWAYWEALRVALEADVDGGVILEDDVAFCPRAVARMALFPIPEDLGFVQFFAPASLQVAKMYPGLWRTPAPALCTQAIKFTRSTLKRLLAWADSQSFASFKESDQALELARVELGIKFAAHCPELVQHIGAKSAATPGEGLEYDLRHSKTFSARLDAMALFSRQELYR